MRAVVIARPGGPEVLEVREVPTPEPQGSEILVRVRACGLNRADLMQAKGHYPAPAGAPKDIPGLEYAGVVEAIGPLCTGPWKPGDRVFGIVAGGGLAECVLTHERLAVAIPPNLDFEQAAAVPEAFLTAHDALETQGELRPGQRVLIHAVAGGVGSAALQIAHAMGCTTFGTSRTAAKLEQARELGLDVAIDAGRDRFPDVIARETADAGVHVAMDHLGGPALADNLAALATRGRLVVVGLLAGSEAAFDLRTLMAKRLTIVGTTLRARPLEEKIAATLRFAERVVPWLARGAVRPILDRGYPLADVREAVAYVASNEGFGKVVLVP